MSCRRRQMLVFLKTRPVSSFTKTFLSVFAKMGIKRANKFDATIAENETKSPSVVGHDQERGSCSIVARPRSQSGRPSYNGPLPADKKLNRRKINLGTRQGRNP